MHSGTVLNISCHMQAATTRDGGELGHLLWQLVAASAHIIVPAAAFNLKARIIGLCREAAQFRQWVRSSSGRRRTLTLSAPSFLAV